MLNSWCVRRYAFHKQMVCTCASWQHAPQITPKVMRAVRRNPPGCWVVTFHQNLMGLHSILHKVLPPRLLGIVPCTPGGTAASGPRPGLLLGCGPSRPASRHPVR